MGIELLGHICPEFSSLYGMLKKFTNLKNTLASFLRTLLHLHKTQKYKRAILAFFNCMGLKKGSRVLPIFFPYLIQQNMLGDKKNPTILP